MSSSPCAACKLLRRKCTPDCIFAPYFPPEQPFKFANVHRVFGASNVGKLLRELNPEQREEAVVSLAYEAEERLRDRVYGCVGYIYSLHSKIRQVQLELANARKQLAKYVSSAAFLPQLPPHGAVAAQHLFQAPPTAVAPFGISGQPQGQLVMNEQQLLLLLQLQMGQQLQPQPPATREQEMTNGLPQHHHKVFDGMTGLAPRPEMFNCGFAIEQLQPSAAYAERASSVIEH